MKPIRLKRCPFCGGKAVYIHTIGGLPPAGTNKRKVRTLGHSWVECSECHTTGPCYAQIDHTNSSGRAMNAWNRRAKGRKRG